MDQEKKMNKWLFLPLSILIFTGCITKEVPSFNTYTLSLKQTVVSKSSKILEDSIFVSTPKTIASLNSTAIFYSEGSHRQEAYAFSRWSDTPAKMIQQLLTQRLSNLNQFTFVSSSKLKTKASIVIHSELVDFKQYINDNDESKVTLYIRVYKTQDNHTVSKNFVYEQNTLNNAQDAVKGWNIIINRFVKDASEFITK
jgi:cholesterol transport system auxiliary component